MHNAYDKFMSQLQSMYNSYVKKRDDEDMKILEKDPIVNDYQKTKTYAEQKSDAIQDSKLFIYSKNWSTMVCIMLGIEKTVVLSKGYHNFTQLTGDDFDKKWTDTDNHYKNKNYFTISHPSLTEYDKCQFIDIAPLVFHDIRQRDRINEDEYLKSLGPDALSSILSGQVSTFSGLGSFGKSGSFFFYTYDQKYMVKTIKKNEVRQLKDI